MMIRPVDLSDDAELHELYVVVRDSIIADNPDRPIWTEELMAARVREPTEDLAVEVWAAVDEASPPRLVGAALMFLPLLDNQEKVYAGVAVHPGSQRRGVGGELIEHLVGRAAARGRTVVLSDAIYAFDQRDDHGYRRFAERHGFRVASTEVTRRLDLPVDEAVLQVWADEAAPHHRDYRIETYDDIPDDLLPSVCHVVNQLALEAPSGDIDFEAQQMTPEMHRHARERDRRSGTTSFDTLGIDRTGQAVAVTTLTVDAGDESRVHQQATIVHRDHRGHRLGLAVKAANLRAVQRAFPDRTAVYTSNHEDNAQMVAINERMGFQPLELSVGFMRTLTP